MAEAIQPMSGAEALDYVSGLLDLQTAALFLDRVPKTGRCVVVCNHPTGIADGLAVYDAIKRVRGDAIFFAASANAWAQRPFRSSARSSASHSRDGISGPPRADRRERRTGTGGRYGERHHKERS